MSAASGVTRALASERSTRVSELRYELRLSIPLDRDARVHGSISISFVLLDTGKPLALDFAPGAANDLTGCTVNGRALQAAIEDEHIAIPAQTLVPGANTILLSFLAGDAPLNRRADHLYTVFVPARAREAFPCFDQPDLRGRFALTLEIPAGWVAVSNAELAGEVTTRGDTCRFAFAQTAPLPTYLFAFAAGRFLEDVVERGGRELRIYHTSSDAELVHANRDAIIEGHVRAIAWMEDYTAIAYPFGKFDIVLLPAFQFGGMEHPGAIFYNATAFLLTASATRQQLLARASVIAHETAHMWFGDLVTITWFDDVWMKEVFANFMAAKIVNPEFPDLDHDLRFLMTHYPAAYDVDRTAGANPIRQTLENLRDAGSLYGAIVYLKSPIVMRQLELSIGEDQLRTALRDYLTRFAFSHASWPDLLTLLEMGRSRPLRAWSQDWLETPGRPTIRSARVAGADGSWQIEIQSVPPHDQRLDVAFGTGQRIEHASEWLEGDVSVSRVGPAPDFVLPNGRGLGYGDFVLDDTSLAWLLGRLPEVKDALTRGSAWLTLWDAMLAARVTPEGLFDLGVAAVQVEDSELNLQRMLNDLERTFWLFLRVDQRTAVASRLERPLQERLERESQVTVKAALFASLRSIATSGTVVEWMRAVWSGDARIEGLALREADHIVLAQELSVRSGDADDIISRQLARTESEDRRAALAFVAPSLSADPAKRAQFFDTVTNAANRRREPWVIDGMRWLHHPLRAEASLVHVRPALELLEEVKRTGDIFLPKRWLDAIFSGHRSTDAVRIVREFLDSRSETYPRALRRMILASADYLFRAAGQRTAGPGL